MYLSKKDLFSLDLSLLSQQAAVPWLKKHLTPVQKCFKTVSLLFQRNILRGYNTVIFEVN
jgi:hypothetical protein